MGKEHELKTWPAYFAAVADGSKPFEVRYNDRNYALGDTLYLREWEPGGCVCCAGGAECLTTGKRWGYTGREMRVVVTYVLHSSALRDGYVVMGIRSNGGSHV